MVTPETLWIKISKFKEFGNVSTSLPQCSCKYEETFPMKDQGKIITNSEEMTPFIKVTIKQLHSSTKIPGKSHLSFK